MSVAFRRDGDDEHLEPKFEIPIPPGPNRVTARGLARIRARVAELVAQVASEIAKENADESRLAAVRRELRYWQTREITAELMPAASGKLVEFGTRVTFQLKGKPRQISIVGDDEADPALGLLAFASPLARALLGGEPGECLPFAGQEDAIEIETIEAI